MCQLPPTTWESCRTAAEEGGRRGGEEEEDLKTEEVVVVCSGGSRSRGCCCCWCTCGGSSCSCSKSSSSNHIITLQLNHCRQPHTYRWHDWCIGKNKSVLFCFVQFTSLHFFSVLLRSVQFSSVSLCFITSREKFTFNFKHEN